MIRVLALINEMARQGMNVDLIVAHPNENSIYFNRDSKIDKRINITRIGPQKSLAEKVKYLPPDSLKSAMILFVRKLYKYVDLFGASIELLHYADKIPDSIISNQYSHLVSFSSPIVSHILSNRIYSQLKHKPYYIQQWGDPLSTNITDKTIIPNIIKRRIEHKILAPADKVVYVSPITALEQKRLFKTKQNSIYYIPTPASEVIHADPITISRRIKLGYYGSYYTVARDIHPLYAAVKDNSGYELEIIGDSNVKLDSVENVKIKNRVSKDVINDSIASCQILVCLLNRSGGQIPGKVFSYARTSKEVLMIIDGERGDEIQNYFSKYDRYTFCHNNVASIANSLSEYLKNNISPRKPLDDFSPQNVLNEMMSK